MSLPRNFVGESALISWANRRSPPILQINVC